MEPRSHGNQSWYNSEKSICYVFYDIMLATAMNPIPDAQNPLPGSRSTTGVDSPDICNNQLAIRAREIQPHSCGFFFAL